MRRTAFPVVCLSAAAFASCAQKPDAALQRAFLNVLCVDLKLLEQHSNQAINVFWNSSRVPQEFVQSICPGRPSCAAGDSKLLVRVVEGQSAPDLVRLTTSVSSSRCEDFVPIHQGSERIVFTATRGSGSWTNFRIVEQEISD
jgi:hypothetical protein